LHFFVIPAEAGIQLLQMVLDSRLRGSDSFLTFYESINIVKYHLQIYFKYVKSD